MDTHAFPAHPHHFGPSGSYAPGDVHLLLEPAPLDTLDVARKEAAIQAGRHYGEMLSEEPVPDPLYHGLYADALARGQARMGGEVWALAEAIQAGTPGGCVLVSLVRGGTPYGVLLKRALERQGHGVVHYGVSIMRGKGLDARAMGTILAQHPPSSLVFVDGWTGKGAISTELRQSWAALGLPGQPTLAVLADPCGAADLAGSAEDWLIPSGLLNGNICGLISRTVLPLPGTATYHRAMHLGHLAGCDVSRAFVEAVCAHWPTGPVAPALDAQRDPSGFRARREACARVIDAAQARFGVPDRNRIKPGISEATRAVLRRVPEKVVLRALDDPDLAGLIHLCQQRGVPLLVDPALTGPYRALTLIGKA